MAIVNFRDRFGNEVKFERKEKHFEQRPGEEFLTALMRTYYPREYARHEKVRQQQKKED